MYKNKSQLLFRRLCLIVVDIISIILSFFLSAFIAYDGSMELSFLKYTYFFYTYFTHRKSILLYYNEAL